MSLQNLERRFGITAVKQGFITAEQLIEAISIQTMEALEDSGHRQVGEILFEKQHITSGQIKEVLKQLGISQKLISRAHRPPQKAVVAGTDEEAMNDPELVFSPSL